MKPEIVITGASGFVGDKLASELIARGFNGVVCVSRGTPNRHGLPQVYREVKGDTDWKGILEKADVVVHCAAVSSSDDVSVSRIREVNTEGTIHLARCAANAGVRRFVFLSTVKVLGENSCPETPFTSDSTLSPEDDYAASKAAAEAGLAEIAKNSRMETVVIRPPLVYGPGVKGNFAQMISAVRSGIPLPLRSLHNRRSIVSIYNLVDLTMECISNPAAANECFLVSDGEDVSTSELLRRIGLACGREPRLLPIPVWLLRMIGYFTGKSGQVNRLVGSLQVDISRNSQLLGWSPSVPMQWALEETVRER